MSRPGFARGLGPTPWEYFVFLIWLGFVLLSMTAMVRVPAFHLLFWPCLWSYDLWKAASTRNALDPASVVRSGFAKPPPALWDRELDG